MPCQRKKTDPVASHQDINGWWHFMCPTCLVCTPRTSKNYDQALFYFWKEHDYRNKETKMYVPANPHEAYRMGIEDALKEAKKDFSIPQVACVYIRKKLMDEHKTTWWFNIYEHPKGNFYMSTCLWNSEEKAKNDPSPNLRGTYPIEIETEI